MLKKDENTGTYYMESKYNQQFPQFLSNLKSKNMWSNLYIFLMDPVLEHPPWIVTSSIDGYEEDKHDDNQYHEYNTNIHVYEFPYAVTYPSDRYSNTNSVNITNFLDTLNKYAIQYKWLVIAHDFSGRNINKLTKFYNNILENDLNHIVYGLAAGEDYGCYIELDDPKCDFVFEKNHDGITVFNPYSYEKCMTQLKAIPILYKNYYKENPVFISEQEAIKNINIIQSQIDIFFQSRNQHIMSIMTCYRQIAGLKNGMNIDLRLWNYTYIRDKYCIDINKLIDNKNYNVLLEHMLTILKEELIIFFNPLYNDNTHNLVNSIIKYIITENNIYKWEQYVKNAIQSVVI
jgi:hypothetical protein